MTTGTTTTNLLVPITFTPSSGTGGGTTSVGKMATRSWSGVDRSVAEKASRVVAAVPKTYKPGSKNQGLRWGGKKPKMKRLDTPHSYSVSWKYASYGQYRAVRNDTDTYKWFNTLWMVGNANAYAGYQADTYPKAAIDPAQEYRLLAKIRDRIYASGFHPGITLGEGPKALRMIGTAAKRLRRGFFYVATGDMRGAFRVLGDPDRLIIRKKLEKSFLSYNEGRKTLASLWLELQYGWLPLIGDIESGAKYIGNVVGGAYPVSQGVSASRSWENVYKRPNPDGWFYLSKQTVRNQLRYKITNLQVAAVTGLPPIVSAAGVAWELLPYSFIADWVAPISGYLEACRISKNITGSVVRSHKQTMIFSEPRFGTGSFDTRSGYTFGPSTNIELGWFTRTVSSEISPPSPVGDLSPSSIYSTWKRAVNSIALLQNLRIPEGDKLGFKRMLR